MRIDSNECLLIKYDLENDWNIQNPLKNDYFFSKNLIFSCFSRIIKIKALYIDYQVTIRIVSKSKHVRRENTNP